MSFDRQNIVPKRLRTQGLKYPGRRRIARSVGALVLLGAFVLAGGRDGRATAAPSKGVFGADTSPASPMLEALTQNTPGHSEGFPAGVPRRYSWCSGSYKPADNATPPTNFTAVTGWGQVYPKAGAATSPARDAALLVANAKTYIHLSKTREWIAVQDQADDEIAGAHFVADLAGNQGSEMKVTALPDGTTLLDAPQFGFNDLFWMIKRGAYDAGSVDGVYVQMDMKTTDPDIKLVANVGADWWRDPTAGYVQGFNNNRGAGTSNWVELSAKWSTLHFYSVTNAQLLADPPPPLAETAQRAEPILAPRRLDTLPICPPGM
jgi:hypothetical protein